MYTYVQLHIKNLNKHMNTCLYIHYLDLAVINLN